MTAVGIMDKRWKVSITGHRIPASEWQSTEQATKLVEQANAVIQQAQEEADRIRKEAYQTGFEKGCSDALAQHADTLARAQIDAQQFIKQSEQRVTAMAVAVIQKILPSFNEQEVLLDLAGKALKAIRAEHYIKISVHPKHEKMLDSKVAIFRKKAKIPQSITVEARPDLGYYDCLVESELGVIKSGFSDQLSQLMPQLERALQHD